MKINIDVSNGKNVFFISDLHLGHRNIIKYDNRPFVNSKGEPDLASMHETIIKNWNSVVNENDIVFNLGDLCFGTTELAKEIVFKLNGKIHYVIGNHDNYKDILNLNRFETVSDLIDLNISGSQVTKNLHMVLCHYPIYSWNRAHHNSYHIHGHTHGSLHHGESADYYIGRRVIDVGCNLINYTPITYLDAIEKMEENGKQSK
jgi:calcineurin-like phosphoesterase family protein